MLVTPLEENMEYTSGYKYQLGKDIRFLIPELAAYAGYADDYLAIEDDGILLLKHGYACDGPSGPTIDTPSAMRGAFVHDALYQLIRKGVLSKSFKPIADAVLREICILDRMWKVRAWLWEKVLGRYGWANVLPSHRKVVKYAP